MNNPVSFKRLRSAIEHLFPLECITILVSVVALMNELYTFGRSIECDVMITEEHANKEFLTVISKVQFAIYKESLEGVDNVYLEDRSMNGTFVNQHKVGKGNKIVLNCGDKISLASPYNIGKLDVESKIYLLIQ